MPTTVYAGGEDNPTWEESHAAIVRSLDDGASWTEVFTLPPSSEVRALAIDPADRDVVYAGGWDCSGTSGPGCAGFLYRTTDGGDSWDLTLATTDTVRSIVIDRWRPDVLYVADDGYWVRKSIDGGDSYQPLPGSGSTGNVNGIATMGNSVIEIAEPRSSPASWASWRALPSASAQAAVRAI